MCKVRSGPRLSDDSPVGVEPAMRADSTTRSRARSRRRERRRRRARILQILGGLIALLAIAAGAVIHTAQSFAREQLPAYIASRLSSVLERPVAVGRVSFWPPG